MARRLLNVLDTFLLDPSEGEIEPQLSYSWTDMGVDTVIAATISASCRVIRSLTKFDNVVWLGHGDTGASSRPLRARYFNPADDTFNTVGSHGAGFSTDGLNTQFVYNNNLYLGWQDPADPGNTEDYAVLTSRTTATVVASADIAVLEHLWCFCEHDGALYAAGASLAGNEPTVWKSTNNGTTWVVSYNPLIADINWFTGIFSFGGFVWTQPYDANLGLNRGNLMKSADGVSWSDAGFPITSPSFTSSSFVFAIPVMGKMAIFSTGVNANTAKLSLFDGTASASDITALLSPELIFGVNPVARAMSVVNDTLYGVGNNQIRMTTDGANATLLTTCPTVSTVRSILVELDGTIWCGTTNSHLWRGIPSAEPTRTGTYLVDNSGNYVIDHKGDFVIQG